MGQGSYLFLKVKLRDLVFKSILKRCFGKEQNNISRVSIVEFGYLF